jgi:hypothetical protein
MKRSKVSSDDAQKQLHIQSQPQAHEEVKVADKPRQASGFLSSILKKTSGPTISANKKRSRSEEEADTAGEGNQSSAPPPQDSVEYWNLERSKLGLKPLRE